MKKIFLFLLTFNISFANVSYSLYENYVEDILNYSLKLNTPPYNPFYISHKVIDKKNIKKSTSDANQHFVTQIKPKLKVLAILNNKVLLNFKHMKKNEKKWLKIGESLENYKLIKITKGAVLFKHEKKIEVLQTNIKTNKFKLKVVK